MRDFMISFFFIKKKYNTYFSLPRKMPHLLPNEEMSHYANHISLLFNWDEPLLVRGVVSAIQSLEEQWLNPVPPRG
jgi:hypothetical protein